MAAVPSGVTVTVPATAGANVAAVATTMPGPTVTELLSVGADAVAGPPARSGTAVIGPPETVATGGNATGVTPATSGVTVVEAVTVGAKTADALETVPGVAVTVPLSVGANTVAVDVARAGVTVTVAVTVGVSTEAVELAGFGVTVADELSVGSYTVGAAPARAGVAVTDPVRVGANVVGVTVTRFGVTVGVADPAVSVGANTVGVVPAVGDPVPSGDVPSAWTPRPAPGVTVTDAETAGLSAATLVVATFGAATSTVDTVGANVAGVEVATPGLTVTAELVAGRSTVEIARERTEAFDEVNAGVNDPDPDHSFWPSPATLFVAVVLCELTCPRIASRLAEVRVVLMTPEATLNSSAPRIQAPDVTGVTAEKAKVVVPAVGAGVVMSSGVVVSTPDSDTITDDQRFATVAV